jgi:hypothetical protein
VNLPAVLQPQDEFRFNVTFTANSTDIVLTKFMAIATNQSQHRLHIPLFTYNGQLRYAISDKVRAGRAQNSREGYPNAPAPQPMQRQGVIQPPRAVL